jgi:hypothetical protein
MTKERNNALIPIASLGYFSGIDNITDPVRMKPTPVKTSTGYKSAYPLSEAINVDIDNSFALSSRSGSLKKLSGANVHSLWAKDLVGFFVDGTNLYSLDGNYTATLLLSGLTNGARMSYFQVNDRIYMTNGSYIGYYSDSSMHSLSAPAIQYKLPLPAGQRIACFQGVIFVAKGKVLYVSDALCDHYDIRTGFRVFEKDINMLRPVDNGIFVSDGNTYFLTEKRMFADDPATLRKDPVLNIDVIPFSDTLISGAFVGEGIEGNVAMWTTAKGVCVGDNKGNVKIVTPKYLVNSAAIGYGAVRNINGQVHYLTTIN